VSHKDGRVVLSAWVEPVLRDYAREAAKVANLEFSRWVERAVRQTMARESADRVIAAANERGECGTCDAPANEALARRPEQPSADAARELARIERELRDEELRDES
jgi:hypothetical protein